MAASTKCIGFQPLWARDLAAAGQGDWGLRLSACNLPLLDSYRFEGVVGALCAVAAQPL